MDKRFIPVRPKGLNADEKHRLTAADLQLFTKQYGRKAQKGMEPNDRRYPREIERKAKRMPPEVLDQLLRGEE